MYNGLQRHFFFVGYDDDDEQKSKIKDKTKISKTANYFSSC